jgi:C1A family cysteine protease
MASMLLTEIEITPEEKRAALQFALNSESLSRSDRLKSLLSYLCEAEFSGTHNKLTEYDIAVSALGRRSDFSPVEDSTVRSLRSSTRQKHRNTPFASTYQRAAIVPSSTASSRRRSSMLRRFR